MSLNSRFLVLFLFCKLTCGLITHNAGYQTEDGEYYGSEARIGAWGVPDMDPNSSYEVSIILINFNNNHTSLIKAGLHVNPWLYHDNQLRIFTSWNDDATRNPSCYNMKCDHFVVANKSVIYPGEVVKYLSQYNGDDWYFRLRILKDPLTEFWTLYQEHLGVILKIGWWRKGLGDLDNKATSVQWIGFVNYPNDSAGPAMGSGHFPIEGKRRAAYIMDLKLFNKTGNIYDSPQTDSLVEEVDKPDCYRVRPAYLFDDETADRHKFYYGGPTGCKN